MKKPSFILAAACGLTMGLSAVQANDYQVMSVEDAKNLLQNQITQLNVTEQDIQNALVSGHYMSDHNGVTHLVLNQQHNGIKVYNGVLQLNVDHRGEVINMHNFFTKDLATSAPSPVPTIPADLAIMNAAAHLGIATGMPAVMTNQFTSADQSAVYRQTDVSLADIPVQLMYQHHRGSLRLTWDMQIQTESNWWNIRVDAISGQVIDQVSWMAHASYDVIPYPNDSLNPS